MAENLIEAIQSKVAEIRETYIPTYMSIGREGAFGVFVLRTAIQQAEQAVATMDTVEMVRMLQELRDLKL